jgi:hypothetical protein
MLGCDAITPSASSSTLYPITCDFKERKMKAKINEDWLATIIAFVLLILAMVNFIKPDWVKF